MHQYWSWQNSNECLFIELSNTNFIHQLLLCMLSSSYCDCVTVMRDVGAAEVVLDHRNPLWPENGHIVQRVDRVSDLRALNTGSLFPVTKTNAHITSLTHCTLQHHYEQTNTAPHCQHWLRKTIKTFQCKSKTITMILLTFHYSVTY